jgi:hypothetical protein
MLGWLIEGLVSLAIRSPMNRRAFGRIVERGRGRPVPERERNLLIAANMRGSLRKVVDSIGNRAKFAVIFSQGREFIFGDGFYHNVVAAINAPLSPTVLAPLTPELSVLMATPARYTAEPKLSTIVVSNEEVNALNLIVQIYAKEEIFYRAERPPLTEHFTANEHRELALFGENPIEEMIAELPGVLG